MSRLILGSASTGRRRVLRGAGVDPLVIVSGVDEDAVMAALPADAGPDGVTIALATAKARAVAATLEPRLSADSVVIGCDSMLLRDGKLWGKPGSEAAVIDGWNSMAGSTAELYTGHCLIRLRDGVVEHEFAESSRTGLRFGRPTPEELTAYARSGEPAAVAGGFTLDGLGGWFVEAVDGDPSAVIGIGLPLIRSLLAKAGVSVAALWAANPVDRYQ